MEVKSRQREKWSKSFDSTDSFDIHFIAIKTTGLNRICIYKRKLRNNANKKPKQIGEV